MILMLDGIFLIDKEAGMTSRKVDNILGKRYGTHAVGHLGTLDPFATGLLVVAINKGTKLLTYLNDGDKTYEATLLLGENTSTGELEGEVIEKKDIPDFKAYFDTYAKKLKLQPGQTLHFELGRAVVAQCGSLITRTLYIKEGAVKKFAIVDAGFTDLIRPALYQAYHKIENITSDAEPEAYDVVGPICESTDVFAKQIDLNKAKRGDLMAIRSAGAYGEIMASQYNCRRLPKGYMSDEL